MIELALSNVKEFKTILTVAETILNEIKMEIDNDGMRFRGLDGGHTSFFEANFNKDYFSSFKISAIDNIIIDTNELAKIFKRIKNDDDTTLIIDKDVLSIKVKSDKSNKTFQIKGVDMEYDSPSMPNIEYPINIDVDFKEFKDNVGDAGLYEDKLRIKTEDGNLIIFNDSVIGNYKSVIEIEEPIDKNCSSVFSIDLINKIFKLTTLSDSINIKMGTDIPILLSLNDTFEDVFIKLLVAPRIEK